MKRRLSLLLAIMMLISVICVVPVSVSAEGAYTVYCINSAKWDTVCVYAWGDSALEWPGVEMTKTGETVNGFDVYAYTTDTAYANVIFNNNNQGSQTGDLAWTNGQYYDVKAGTWYASIADVPVVDATATDVYLAGEMNGWSTVANEFKLSAEGETVAYLTMALEAETSYQFKVVNSGSWISTTIAITDTVSGVAFNNSVSDNATITTTVAGDYVFAWDTTASTLSVEYPVAVDPTEAPVETTTAAPVETTTAAPAETEPAETTTSAVDPTEAPAETYTIYCIAGEGWNNANAYMWNSNEDTASAWPGIAMTKTALTYNGRDVYEYTSEKAWANVVFNNGSTQTDDLTFTAGQYYDVANSQWLESIDTIVDPTEAPVETTTAAPEVDTTGDETPTEAPTEAPTDSTESEVETIRVFFQNNWLWSEICVYFWGSASGENPEWRGVAMNYYDNDGTYDIYYYDVPADITGMIITGIKDDGSGSVDKTPDIVDFADGKCYYMTWNDGNAVGSVNISEIFPEEEAKAEIAGYSISLGDTIGVKFYYSLSDDVAQDADAKVVFTVPDSGSTYTYEQSIGSAEIIDGFYVFTCYVAAKEMTSKIQAQFVSSIVESEVTEYTVKDYAVYMIQRADVYAAEQALVKAMLNYGAAAQIYFDYNTDNLANNTTVMTDTDRTIEPVDFSGYTDYTLSGEEAGVTYYGTALSLKSELAIKHYFIIDESVDVASLELLSNRENVSIAKNGNLYEVKISGIPAHTLGSYTTIRLGGLTLQYDIFDYGKDAQNSDDADLYNVMNALSKYYSEARLYSSN
ncbi:MAG: starch-binding protein [Ruminococcus sp.]|nr:starch-binding protein [Ruminococcus sp.]